jgi:release factor glutamine methyltransferase
VQGDLLDWLQAQRARFHLILSNPPYVSERDWEQLAPEVRNREPRIALCAGERGTELQERILRRAGGFLLPRGALIMEIGETQAPDLLEAAGATGLYETATVFPDYGGRPRVLVARKPGPAEPAQTGGSAASEAS